MRTNPHIALALGALLLVQGCASGWTRVAPPPQAGAPWPARQRAQVWRGGRSVVWHAVRVRGDSLSGVPFVQSPSCDSCRVAVALAEVDSIRTGDPSGAAFGTLSLVGVFILAVYLYICRFCGGT